MSSFHSVTAGLDAHVESVQPSRDQLENLCSTDQSAEIASPSANGLQHHKVEVAPSSNGRDNEDVATPDVAALHRTVDEADQDVLAQSSPVDIDMQDGDDRTNQQVGPDSLLRSEKETAIANGRQQSENADEDDLSDARGDASELREGGEASSKEAIAAGNPEGESKQSPSPADSAGHSEPSDSDHARDSEDDSDVPILQKMAPARRAKRRAATAAVENVRGFIAKEGASDTVALVRLCTVHTAKRYPTSPPFFRVFSSHHILQQMPHSAGLVGPQNIMLALANVTRVYVG